MYPSRTIPENLQGRVTDSQYAAALGVYDCFADQEAWTPEVFHRMLLCMTAGLPVAWALPYESTGVPGRVALVHGALTPAAEEMARSLYAVLDLTPVIAADEVAAVVEDIAEKGRVARLAYIAKRHGAAAHAPTQARVLSASH